MTIHPCYVGCDVSKAHLDLFHPGTGQLARIANTEPAIEDWLDGQALQGLFIVHEATGHHDRVLRQVLARHGIASARLNPMMAKRFAQATGQRAKTDAIDARVLSRLGASLHPPADPPGCARRERLVALVRLRDQLVDNRAKERQRLSAVFLDEIAAVHREMIDLLNERIDRVERQIREAIQSDRQMAERAALLDSVPGIGPVSAATLIALMPELGQANPKKLAALAGLAPFNHDSGALRGHRKIAGGRRRVRHALYMTAISAARFNPKVRHTYDTLIEKGKPAKLALIAVARKLLVIVNAIIRDQKAFA